MKQNYNEAFLYKVTRPIVTFLFIHLYKPKISGKENIPKEGRIILAGNHTNNFDCFLLMSSTKRCIHFLAKDELWKVPKKIFFSHMGLIPVNRRKKDPNSLFMAKNYLKHEKVIGIFPEGTVSKDGNLLPFKYGAVKMALDTNTKIIPFAIKGKYKLFSKDLQIIFGKEISITKELEKENKKLQNKVKELLR